MPITFLSSSAAAENPIGFGIARFFFQGGERSLGIPNFLQFFSLKPMKLRL